MFILETKDLTVDFKGFKAVDKLDFSLKKGEIRTVLGPNGAGKTTFLDLITGKIRPTNGKIIFNGKDITGLNATEVSNLGMGRKFQGPNIFGNLSVMENIEVALKGKRNVFQTLFFKISAEIENKIKEILTNIGLLHRKDTLASILSHGEKQWLEMGMILAQDPELIILDEPTTGMTSEETRKTGELIQTIFKNQTVIVVEHDMTFVRQIAQKVTVLHQGRFLAEGTMQEIEENAEVQKVYLRG